MQMGKEWHKKIVPYSGADPGFQVRGVHLTKLCQAEGDAKIFGVFRVKNHDFMQKILFFSIAEGGAIFLGVFRVKNHDFTPKNHIFSNLTYSIADSYSHFRFFNFHFVILLPGINL